MRHRIFVSVTVCIAVLPVVAVRAVDCNLNGIDDSVEIARGDAKDCDNNGRLDDCSITPGLTPGGTYLYPSLDVPVAFAAFDSNGDGNMELAAVGNGSLSTYSLSEAREVEVGPVFDTCDDVVAMVSIDMDDDEIDELAIACAGANPHLEIISPYLGGLVLAPLLSSDPLAVAAIEVDHDGRVDLVVAGPSEVIVLGNDGENFVEIQRLSDVVVSERNSVVTEDFDADGLGDVALVNTRASTLSIFHGGVDGRLAAPETVAFVRRPVALTAADFDVDGDVDFVVAHEGTGDLTVIWSEEKRSYTQINYRGFENYDYDANSLSVGNLNGDDVPDIAVSGVLQTDITRWIVRTIVGFPGGGFADAETLTDRETPVGADRPQVLITNFRRGAVDQVVTATPGFSRVAIFGVENEGGGDFNGDGIPDNCRFHTFRRGDANSDEEVNISDAVDILTHLFVIRQDFSCSKSADVNDDGNINISDSIGLLGYLFLGSSAPPAPFPDCGLEETQDRLWCEEPVCGV